MLYILFESIDPIFFDIFSPGVEPVFSVMSIQKVTYGMCMLDFNDPNLNSSFYIYSNYDRKKNYLHLKYRNIERIKIL